MGDKRSVGMGGNDWRQVWKTTQRIDEQYEGGWMKEEHAE